VFRYAHSWLWHMVAGFLFWDGSQNTTSWLVLLILCLEWDAIATYNWGLLHWLGCTIRCSMGSLWVVWTPTLEVACTSYRSGCGNVSRSLGRTVTALRYALIYLFSLYIIYVNCVLVRIWNLIFSHGHLRTWNRNPCWVTAGRGSQTSHAP
jgi:hypothetical protein